MTKAKTSLGEKLKKNIFIIIFIILAIIASATIYYFVKSLSPTVPVVVAKETIKVGQVLEQKDLSITYLPPSSVPNSAFTTMQDLVGKTIISGPIIYGDMIRQEHLSAVGSLKSLLHTFTPEGWHAIELPAGMGLGLQGLKKGDYIQVYGDTFTEEGIIAGLIVPDAIVLSVAGYDLSESNHIIAVPKDYVGVIADSIVKGTPLAIALPDTNLEKTLSQLPQEALENLPETSNEIEGEQVEQDV